MTAARWCGVCAPVLPDVLVDVDGWEPPPVVAEEQLDLFGGAA